MSDLPPKVLDIPREKIKPPVIEQKTEIPQTILDVVTDNKGYVRHIIYPTFSEINKLNNEIIANFIKNLKINLKAEDFKLKQAIENKTLKIDKVPGRPLIAISLNGTNCDLFYNIDGTFFEDLSWRRENKDRYKLFLDTLKDYKLEEKYKNGKFILYKNGKEIYTFSNEYYNEILKPVDFIKHFVKALEESLK